MFPRRRLDEEESQSLRVQFEAEHNNRRAQIRLVSEALNAEIARRQASTLEQAEFNDNDERQRSSEQSTSHAHLCDFICEPHSAPLSHGAPQSPL